MDFESLLNILSTSGIILALKGFSFTKSNASTIRVTELVGLGEDPCPGVSTAVNLSQTGTF